MMRVCSGPWISVVAAVLALVNLSAGFDVSVAGKALRRSSFSLRTRGKMDTPTTENMKRPGRSSSSGTSSGGGRSSSSSRGGRRGRGTASSMRSDAGQEELGVGFDFGTRQAKKMRVETGERCLCVRWRLTCLAVERGKRTHLASSRDHAHPERYPDPLLLMLCVRTFQQNHRPHVCVHE